MNGLERIAKAFARAKAEGRPALMPYFTLGFPDRERSLEVVEAIAEAGADLIELGVPFSDPLADGPTIQFSTQVALQQGITLAGCLEMVAELRAKGVEQALLLMGYYNPILAYGVDQFAADAALVGADGFIVPDLPPEEAQQLEIACRECGLALVYLAAPTSTPDRLALVGKHSSGFLYMVSVVGITGARDHLAEDLTQFVRRARAVTNLPLAIGFGISTPEQVRQAGELAEGVIVGSALIQAVRNSARPAEAAGAFVRRLRGVEATQEKLY